MSPRLLKENYPYWHAQALFTAEAHDLEDHLTSLVACLSSFVFVKNETNIGTTKHSNLEYHLWKRCDKFLLSLLLAFIFESMYDHVAKCVTACDVCRAFKSYFVFESYVTVVHLNDTLQALKNGVLDISDYIKRIVASHSQVHNSSSNTIDIDPIEIEKSTTNLFCSLY